MFPDQVAVLLGLQHRYEVHAGPHLLAGELTIRKKRESEMSLTCVAGVMILGRDSSLEFDGAAKEDTTRCALAAPETTRARVKTKGDMASLGENLLLLTDALAELVEAVDANGTHSEEPSARAETGGGQVALYGRKICKSAQTFTCNMKILLDLLWSAVCTG